ncbi:D(1)-like dopamine receptor [Acropora cervicornis]|uniref:D(1)-like dopamine receptor n=1 Tax=Acropora cervicornis TaxID=6130 RepID=A0AAD9QUL8_ACRCE|nr:D(1)-like dopamine receptor [Acropora cervicornis]
MNATNDSLRDKSNEEGVSSNGLATRIAGDAILMLLIVGGNCLVVASYATDRRLRSGTYALLVSLAFSDLLVGGVSIPLRIYGSAVDWNISVHLRTFYVAFDIVSAVASNLHLMAISLERFIAVSRPFYYQTLSLRPYAFGSVVSWSLAIIIAAVHPENYLQKTTSKDSLKQKLLKAYSATLFAVCFLLPLIIISIVNIGIFRIAKALIQRTPFQQATDRQRLRKERKTAFTLLLMTIFFFVAWFPFFVVNMLYLFCLECLPSSPKDTIILVEVTKWLHYSNSAVNPIIYAFRDREMRQAFARLLGRGPLRVFCKVNQVEPRSNFPSSHATMVSLARVEQM